MNIESVYFYCKNKPETTEETPFGPDVLVFKVLGKIFALIPINETPPRINLKCIPERAMMLRETHPAILPGYHMNKKHWNTVMLDGSLPDKFIEDLIDHSFECVVNGMPKSTQKRLAK